MDLDRYLATNQPAWLRLRHLTGTVSRKKATPAEIDEFSRLYQRTATQLSYVRTHYRDASLTNHLTEVVGGAATALYGRRVARVGSIRLFFEFTFPGAVWHCRKAIAVATFAFMAPALAMGLWLPQSDRAADLTLPPAARDAYLNEEFENYYSEKPSAEFASEVFTNNARIGLLAFALGILACVPTLLVLAINGFSIGAVGGMFGYTGQLDKFFGLILPHGLLEITCILIAGGAGLQLGWALIAPGDRLRSTALIEEGRRAVVIVGGLVLAFGLAGLIEGFVTGKPWSTWLRIGIGVAAELLFVAWTFVLGHRAVKMGFTGTMGEQERYLRLSALDALSTSRAVHHPVHGIS